MARANCLERPSPALASRPQCVPHDLPLARVSARHLALVYADPFETGVWEGSPPLCRESVLRRLARGDDLAPGPWRMGHELFTSEDHEARVAWLMARPETWSPLSVELPVEAEAGGPYMNLGDGHHRLAAAILLDAEVDVLLRRGSASVAERWCESAAGQWRRPPQGEVFGEGVLPGHAGPLHAHGQGGKLWVEGLTTGVCLARYGSRVWHVDGRDGGPGQHALRTPDMTETAFLQQFCLAADEAHGRDDGVLSRYLEQLVAG